MDMIKLTSPKGVIYIKKDAITVMCETGGESIRTNIWVRDQEDPFNILEHVETVIKLLS